MYVSINLEFHALKISLFYLFDGYTSVVDTFYFQFRQSYSFILVNDRVR